MVLFWPQLPRPVGLWLSRATGRIHMAYADCPGQASRVPKQGKCHQRLVLRREFSGVHSTSQVARPNYSLWNIPP